MEAASRPALELEPLSELGPELSVAPGAPASASGAAKSATSVKTPLPAAPDRGAMDKDFIARNQIVERYLSGKLPVKGATDFERFCAAHPEQLDEIGLPERVNAGLRLLEVAGKPEPWQEPTRRFWQKPQLLIALAVATLALLVVVAIMSGGLSSRSTRIAVLEKRLTEQPLEPVTNTRTIRILPSRNGASDSPAVVIGGSSAQLADLKIDMSRSDFRNFRVTIDRLDQGRVAILHNLAKDSNGHLRIALNSSALGPGIYQMTIEGITWRGEIVPDAWVTIGISH